MKTLSPHVIVLFILLNTINTQITCHYTCNTCFGTEYYQCLTCPNNRGKQNTFTPIAGMCYCTDQTDEDIYGLCVSTTIAAFIGLALFFTIFSGLLTGLRHFLIKIIQDVQQISIIVLINLYFPQQFDIFLTRLYRFNISSFTFESLTSGSLFVIQSDSLINSTDGQNIFGKYKLLYKTANFFGNQFTWIIVFVCFFIAAIILRYVRNRLRSCLSQQKKVNKNQKILETSIPTDPYNLQPKMGNNIQQNQQKNKTLDTKQQSRTSCVYGLVNKLYNFVWLNFFIIFFYLSLIEININIFTQIGNLTFSSGFAATGAFFSALFLALQCVLLGLLALKIREQTIKPQWMRDYTYTAAVYLIRTNYKTITKYFWLFACIKKIFLALIITTLYQSPGSAIIGISSIQMIFICFAVYCQPFERRYIRIHFYACEGMKLFLYVCLVNFTQQYVSYARMIELTKILYFMIAFFFGFTFFYIVINMFAERDIYIRAWIKKFYPDSDSKYKEGRLGYHSQGKLYIYERQ